MKELSGRVIVVMGASSGIGEATVKKIAEKGGKQVIAARRVEKLREIAESLPGAEIQYKAADVSNFEEVKDVIDLALEKYGRIDAIFNNAGIMPTAPLVEGKRDEWQQMLDINIMGVLNGIAAVLPIMAKQKSGHIITTDSVAGHIVYPGSAVYCGTKFALRAIMEGLRQEQRENNIKSTLISPGAVRTELYKTINDKTASEQLYRKQREEGYGLDPEDVAEAVVYAIATPSHVSVSEVIIRPTRQIV
ncbi:MAG: SDR family oxidoreductase [Prevotella sp.]|jgi:NADP-dependent 3-hydroxy acid dehydrogenase YdfG|nr:SDR family oxidoreductase [Prevotella sp.]